MLGSIKLSPMDKKPHDQAPNITKYWKVRNTQNLKEDLVIVSLLSTLNQITFGYFVVVVVVLVFVCLFV